MKVLVTGANGFIGRNLVERLRGTPSPDLFKGKGTIEIITVDKEGDVDLLHDLKHTFDWQPTEKIDAVIHLAAKSGVRSFDVTDYENNVGATESVLRWMSRYDVPMIVYAGSSSVYGNAKVMDEGQIPAPQSQYAHSKWECEKRIEAWVRSNGKIGVTLRLFNAIGKYQRRGMLPTVICENMKHVGNGDALGSIPIYGQRFRAWTYVGDIVNGFWSALNSFYYSKAGTYLAFNMGTTNSMTQRDLIRAFEERAGMSTMTRDLPPHEMDVQRTKADMTHFRSMFGWEPNNRNIALGIEELLKQHGLIT